MICIECNGTGSGGINLDGATYDCERCGGSGRVLEPSDESDVLLRDLAHCSAAFQGNRSDIGPYHAVRIPSDLWKKIRALQKGTP